MFTLWHIHTPTHLIVLGTHENQDYSMLATHVNKSYRTAMTPEQPAKPKDTKNVKQDFVDIVVEHGQHVQAFQELSPPDTAMVFRSAWTSTASSNTRMAPV